MTCPIVLQINLVDLNSIKLSICFKDGDLWRIHGRISFFWTSPGCFRRILATSDSGVGDLWTRTTPGVALRGRKPRREYFGLLHLTRWTDHVEAKTYFILALYWIVASSAVLVKSQCLRGIVWMDSCRYSHRFQLHSRVNSLRHRHISKTHRVSRVSPENLGMSKDRLLDASFQLHDRALLWCMKDRAGKWEEVNSAYYHRTLNRGSATTCIGFRASEGQRKVRSLIASAVVECCLNYVL